jgi:hypothetical protein
MSRRTWNPVSMNATSRILRGEFGFITTNIGTDPDTSLFFGCGGLTGPDAAAGGANPSPSFVESITKTANAGEFLITYADGYRAQHFVKGECLAPVAGPADGFGVQCAVADNQGDGHETKITQLVTVIDASNAPVETAGRTVMVAVAFKDGS